MTASVAREPDGGLVEGLGAGLLMCASRDLDAKVTFVGVGSPRDSGLVMKVPVTDTAGAAVEREGRVLVAVRRLGLGPLEPSVPRYVRSPQHQGRPTLVSTAAPGTPMIQRYHAWRHTARPDAVARDLDAAARWLTEFQAVTVRQPRPVTWPAETAEALARRWHRDDALPAALVRLDAARDALAGFEVPVTAVHGDFWVGNLLVGGGGDVVGVVDWEMGTDAGCPLRDFARFALSYSLYLDRHTRPGHPVRGHRHLVRKGRAPGIRYALTSPGWYPELVRGFLGDGLERLGVPRSRWYDVAMTGIAEVAVNANEDSFSRDHLRLLGELPVRARRHRKLHP